MGIQVKKIEINKMNERRLVRGADAVELKVTYEDGATELMWNSKRDLKANMKDFPEFKAEFQKGLDFYG